MPYPNYHAARVKSPEAFARIAILKTLPNGILVKGGPLKSNPSGGTTAQTYWFPKGRFSVEQARSWLKSHNITPILFEPATGAAASAILSEAHDAEPIGDAIMQDGEDPVQRFRKDMISEGIYIHPVHKWKLNVTKERIFQWLATYKRMRANGIDVEIPLDHSKKAENNLGYVVDAYIDTNPDGKYTLYGVHEVRGQDAIDIIKRNRNVSIWLDHDYVDGKGNRYGEAIVHSSVVQQPVVQGQQEFLPIAASRAVLGSDEKVPVYILSTKLKGVETMEELLKQIKELLGTEDEVTEENVFSLLSAFVKDKDSKTEDIQSKLTELTKRLDTAETDAKAAGREKAAQKDPDTLELIASAGEKELSFLVKDGKITPAVSEKLQTVLIGAAGGRNAKALCLGENSAPSLLSEVVAALKENDVVKLGEQTGTQVLARNVPGQDENTTPDKEVVTEMVESVDGPETTKQ